LGSLKGGDVEVRKDVACAWRGGGGGESVVEGRFEGGVDGEDVGYAMGIELRGEGVRREGEGEERKNKAVESCMEGSREMSAWFPREMNVKWTWSPRSFLRRGREPSLL